MPFSHEQLGKYLIGIATADEAAAIENSRRADPTLDALVESLRKRIYAPIEHATPGVMLGQIVHKHLSRRILIGTVTSVVAVIIAVVVASSQAQRPQGTIRILSPLPGEAVAKEVHVRIEGLENVQPGDEVHLFEEVGKLLWPKRGRYQGRASHDVTVYFGGPPGNTKIVLAVVGPTGQARIQRWFEESERTGDYFGIPVSEFTDLIVLDAVPVKQTE